MAVDVEVRALKQAVHSGMWGGPVPDALMALARLIASLYDEDGNVAVQGLHVGEAADVQYPARPAPLRVRASPPGVEFIGSGAARSRACGPSPR